MSTIPELDVLKRRLHERQMQRAQYGFSVDPSVVMEIESIEAITHVMGLIDVGRRNLIHLLKQREHFGASVPPHIVNQIANERDQIAARIRLCRERGYTIAAHPVDADVTPIESPTGPIVFSRNPIDTIRESLSDLETMIRHNQKALALDLCRKLRTLLESQDASED